MVGGGDGAGGRPPRLAGEERAVGGRQAWARESQRGKGVSARKSQRGKRVPARETRPSAGNVSQRGKRLSFPARLGGIGIGSRHPPGIEHGPQPTRNRISAAVGWGTRIGSPPVAGEGRVGRKKSVRTKENKERVRTIQYCPRPGGGACGIGPGLAITGCRYRRGKMSGTSDAPGGGGWPPYRGLISLHTISSTEDSHPTTCTDKPRRTGSP
jgi:hypothetical protein